MKNCFFADQDFTVSVRPMTFIEQGWTGYYMNIFVNENEVTTFMRAGITPKYRPSKARCNHFYVSVGLISYKCRIFINGKRVSSLDKLSKISAKSAKVKIIDLELNTYSKTTTRRNKDCYATKLILDVQSESKEFWESINDLL